MLANNLVSWLPDWVATSTLLVVALDIIVLLIIYLLTHVLLSVVLAYIGSEQVAPLPIPNSHFIITGGSSGIGLALAQRLARDGANVTIVARDTTKLQQALTQMKAVAPKKQQVLLQFSCDVGNYEAFSDVVAKAVEANSGRLDCLVASAGITRPELFVDTDIKYISRLMDVNYLGAAYATRAVFPYMKQRGGRVIYVSSILGIVGFPGYAGYCASKWALRGLAQSLHIEWSPYKIAFSVSIPGNVDTPMYEEENKIKPQVVRELEDSKAAGKAATPEEITETIIEAFSNWSFIVHQKIPHDTWISAALTGGLSPASFMELLWQCLLGSIVRPFAALEQFGYQTFIRARTQN